MSKILVTGGAGFIGVNLCHKLVQRGHEVLVIDNMLCPSPMPLPSEASIMEEHIEYFKSFDCPDLNVIYHLASLASPKWYKKYPMRTIMTNVHGTIAACEIAKQNNAKLILASTSEVYGDPEQHPQEENYNGNVDTLSERACYDESKRCAETIVGEYERKGLNAVIVRIFNTYGPGMRPDDGRVVSEFIVRGLKNQPITIYGTGRQTRSFCYINDMVKWLLIAASAGHIGPFNIGNNEEHTILELMFSLQDIMHTEFTVSYEDNDGADPQVRCPNLRRICNHLWPIADKTPLRAGLLETIHYFKRILSCQI